MNCIFLVLQNLTIELLLQFSLLLWGSRHFFSVSSCSLWMPPRGTTAEYTEKGEPIFNRTQNNLVWNVLKSLLKIHYFLNFVFSQNILLYGIKVVSAKYLTLNSSQFSCVTLTKCLNFINSYANVIRVNKSQNVPINVDFQSACGTIQNFHE